LILFPHLLLVRSSHINSSRHPRESGDPATLTFACLNETKSISRFARVTFFACAKKVSKETHANVAPGDKAAGRNQAGNSRKTPPVSTETAHMRVRRPCGVYPTRLPRLTALEKQERDWLGPLYTHGYVLRFVP
jgi:hypothetical protein